MTDRIRKGMCPGCPFDFGKPQTEMAYNLGCLPSVSEIADKCSKRSGAWACHSEPNLLCTGYAAAHRDRIGLPLVRLPGVHFSEPTADLRPIFGERGVADSIMAYMVFDYLGGTQPREGRKVEFFEDRLKAEGGGVTREIVEQALTALERIGSVARKGSAWFLPRTGQYLLADRRA